MVDRAPLNSNTATIVAGASDILPVSLSLRNVDYFVRVGWKQEKQILFGVDADMKPGELTAVMGPSGAGKTTVLNLLTQNASGRIGGALLANGRPLTGGLKTLLNFVPQDDVLLPVLTVRETLAYAAELRMPKGSDRKARVQELAHALGLDDCFDTPVGSVERRGISGGQRKRVSVALELLTRPSVLLLDEPTSGLDSKAAEDVCNMLCKIAAQGHTVVCTIHQPSWKIFSVFQSLLLLANGEVVYHGEPIQAPQVFARLGHPAPVNENPVDHILRIIQEHKFDRVVSSPVEMLSLPEVPAVKYTTSIFRQVYVLFRRNLYDQVKDREKFGSLCAMKVAVSVLIGVAWWSSASPADWKQAFTVTGCLFMLVLQSLMDNIFNTIMRFPLGKMLFLREYKNGSYSSVSWFVAYVSHIIVLEGFAALLLVTPAYFMIRLRPEVFHVALLAIFVCSCIGSTCGILMGALAKDLQQAQGMMLPILVPLILFCGYLIPVDNIPSAFRWIYHVDPFQWAFSILRLNQFDGWVFDECPTPQDRTKGAFCLCLGDHPQCTGVDYLTNVAGLDPDTHPIWKYFLYLCGFFAAILIPTFIVIRAKGNRKTG